MLRAAALLTLALLAVPSASAYKPFDHVDDLNNETFGCVHLGDALVACGVVSAVPGSVAAATGAATGIVEWSLVLRTSSPWTSSSDTATGPAAVLAATGPSTTATCAQATLTANGVVVVSTLWTCF